jgi:hypothetical protein
MKRVVLIAVLAVIATLATGYLLVGRNNRPDASQITDLIERGRSAIESKSVDAAASCLSKSYADNDGRKYEQLRAQVATALRDDCRYEVTVEQPDVLIQGEEATANTHVTIYRVTGESREQAFSGPVKLSLRKEGLRRYLLFPAKEWKITGMAGIAEISIFSGS